MSVHLCPMGDSGETVCCGQTPFDLPMTDRLTLDPELVDCSCPPAALASLMDPAEGHE